jgi:hypothetical protein
MLRADIIAVFPASMPQRRVVCHRDRAPGLMEVCGMVTKQVLRLSWIGCLALVYAAFLFWYQGTGRAITPAEGRIFLQKLATNPGSNETKQATLTLQTLIAHDDGHEFFMFNLETLKAGPEAAKEDRAYASVVLPALLRHGSFPVYLGRVRGSLLGDNTMKFGRASIVRYRSLRDFLEIFTDRAMASGVNHKFASMEYTEARPTSPVISLLAVPLTTALLFSLIAVFGWIRLGRSGPT